MSTINKIEILESGVVQVRINKKAKPGHEEDRDCWGSHRMAMEPGADIDRGQDIINEHFDVMGVQDIPNEEWAKVKAIAALAHTEEAIAAFASKADEPA